MDELEFGMDDLKTAIITDSTCDIPEELIQKYGIRVLPQVIIWGEQTLRDRLDITPQAFYRRLETDPQLPTTTQPSPGDFEQIYREVIAAGAEEIVMITISSAMSGTYQLARQVGEQMPVPVHVVDAKGPTMSLGWQVLAAARARESGGKAQTLIAAANSARESMVQVVLLDSLDYLHRGGRIGSATRMLGSLLNLKPLVQINHQTGLVEPAGRARTRRRAIETLIQLFFGQFERDQPVRVAVLHGAALEEAQALAERIQREYHPVELLVNITGPVLGTNTGPQALALCGYKET